MCSIPQQFVSLLKMMNYVAKFDVIKFDGTRDFRLWQQRVKDLLEQQGMLKTLQENKP